jgi:hypothetical protein
MAKTTTITGTYTQALNIIDMNVGHGVYELLSKEAKITAIIFDSINLVTPKKAKKADMESAYNLYKYTLKSLKMRKPLSLKDFHNTAIDLFEKNNLYSIVNFTI